MRLLFTALACLIGVSVFGQDLDYYFPEIGDDNWETETPENLEWCVNEIDTLISMLDHNNSYQYYMDKAITHTPPPVYYTHLTLPTKA